VLAATRYNLALLGHSQRYMPGVLAFLAVLAIQYTYPSSPPVPEFAVDAGALLVVSCWLTIALLDVEDPVQRLVTLSHARRWWPLIGGVVLTVFACAVAMTFVAEVWSVVEHHQGFTGSLGLSALAQLACAMLGIAIGLPCSRLLVTRVGWTVISAIVALGVVLLSRWVPLVNPMLTAMTNDRPIETPILIAVLLCALALALSSTIVGVLVHRRS
jgi:hypothetical protein